MAEITQLSALASEFPEAPVAYDELFNLAYRLDGRGSDGTIDCIGIVIEIFRRAGLGLPDPRLIGRGVIEFQELFESIIEPDRLYDLAFVGGIHCHVLIVVRPGVAISSKSKTGVYTQSVARLRCLSNVEFFRVRSDRLP